MTVRRIALYNTRVATERRTPPPAGGDHRNLQIRETEPWLRTTGKAAAFFAGEAAWHKLGTVVKECQTSAEAIQLAGLNWTVAKNELQTIIDGKSVTVPSTYAIVRSDTKAVLGTVGDWYRPLQNAEAFEFMDAIVGAKLAMFETAGSLKGGRKVWMLARIPSECRIAKGDIVHPYMLLTNGHDGNNGIRILPTTVRVVCQNTLNLALRRGANEGLSMLHSGSLDKRLEEAREKLQIVARRVDRFGQEARALAKRSLKTNELRDYFTCLVEGRSEKQQKKLLECLLANFENERNNLPAISGSAWAAYNAVSEWADHQSKVLGQGTAALDNRLNSIWFGTANHLKQAAWDAALALLA